MSNLFSFLQDSTLKNPGKVYVVDKGIKWTYSEVFKRVICFSQQLKMYDIHNGDRILIYLDNSVEYIVAFFSILFVNGIVVPVNKNTLIDNIEFIKNDTAAKLLISDNNLLSRIKDRVNLNNCRTINIDLEYSNEPGDVYMGPFEDLTADGNLPAVILYTSGTTRRPKGVTLTHKNLLANTASILQYLKLTSDDLILVTINFSYSYGNSLLLTHTKVGGTLIIENRTAYPIRVVEYLHSSKVTGYSTVGSYINILLKQELLKKFHLENLRYMTFAGESTNYDDLVKLHDLAPHMDIFVMYGQTEASARLSFLEPSMLHKKRGSVGKGIPGVKLRVISEDGKDVEPGKIGEIIANGDNIMKGYWNNDLETKSVIIDGWLHTGDLATMDEDGYIYIKSRKDDIIKYLGHRISPIEIEAAINSCDIVMESAVVLIENNCERQIKAYVVPKGDVFDIDSINSHIKRILPPFKRPQIISFIRELPRTANGKIKRSELRGG